MLWLPIGYGAIIPACHIRLIAPFEGSALKRLRQSLEAAGKVVDATYGHSASSIILTDAHQLIVSAMSAEALQRRLRKHSEKGEEVCHE